MVFDIYNAMQGPNEFVYIGNLKDWNRIPDMHRIDKPTYIIVGEHDELTPACAMKMHHAIPGSTIRVFKNASHCTCFEDAGALLPRASGLPRRPSGLSAVAEPLPGVERQPDAMERVAVEGGEVMTYSFGYGPQTLLLANGGPGLPCDYLRDSHSQLADTACAWSPGTSSAPAAPTGPRTPRCGRSNATRARWSRCAPASASAASMSWASPGAASSRSSMPWPSPTASASLVLSNTVADVPMHLAEMERLRAALGEETVTMMRRREAEGRTGHPEYEAAVRLLNWRHVHRLERIPAPLRRSMEGMVFPIYREMWGENEFACTGNLKEWSRLDELHGIRQPVLIVVGEHDELTTACAAAMGHRLPAATLKVFRNASHSTCFEVPETYERELISFLEQVGAL